MPEPYYYGDHVARFQVLLEEVTRARPGSPETRFISPEGGVLDRLRSRFHHVLYGRRGTGKSSLLRHLEADLRSENHVVAWADQETFMGLSYPDVLVGTLADAFTQFARQIRGQAPRDVSRRLPSLKNPKPSEHEALARQLEAAVAQLIDLKKSPSESEIEWTASYSNAIASDVTRERGGKLAKGLFGWRWSRRKRDVSEQNQVGAVAQRYKATKAEHLERAVTTYRDLMKAVTVVTDDAYIVLDDFYRLAEVDQPRIAGYFHRAVKDTSVWLKFGSIRYWTRLYAGGNPSIGLQVPHDIRDLSLDRGLPDFKTSKRFLEEILAALATEANVNVELLFSAGALDRLVLAAGGVPRDYIGLVSESIAVAKNRGPSAKAGTDRIIAEDVNEAAGRSVDTKYQDLEEDAGADAVLLRSLVVDLTNHCRKTASACFLVDFREDDLVKQLNRLQNMRFVHLIDANETLPDPQSSRYNVYVLDVSQLAAQRAWQVDFMGWTKREKRRVRKLVFRQGEAAAPQEDANPQQLVIDDSLAIVGDIDPPVDPSG